MSRIVCPGCQGRTRLNASGLMVDHGIDGEFCEYSGVMPGDASRGVTREALLAEARFIAHAIANLTPLVDPESPWCRCCLRGHKGPHSVDEHKMAARAGSPGCMFDCFGPNSPHQTRCMEIPVDRLPSGHSDPESYLASLDALVESRQSASNCIAEGHQVVADGSEDNTSDSALWRCLDCGIIGTD